ncbi:MAG TPA: ATP-binding cassette domain-containing protein [Longimicrobiales bacterium]|nr:ATP-binding cassette domain-containing protein [Longimicrobiales bacterium]
MSTHTPPRRADAAAVLEADGVSHAFGEVAALQGADLRVTDGECLALVGESGSGKTTLLRCFNALVRPSTGRLRVRGRAVADSDPVALRRSMGYVPQQGGLLPHWTVGRNVALVPTLLGRSNPEAAARAALERVGLPAVEFADRWPRTLSGGQRQRAALARALAAGPDLVLMDEPLGALDALARAELRHELGALIRDAGVTVLLVTHDLHEAAELADRIAVMKDGRVLQADTLDRLRAAPSDPYVTELLDRGLGSAVAP